MDPPPLVHGTIEANILRTSPYKFDPWSFPLLCPTRLHVTVSLDEAPPIARTADVLQNPNDGTEWNETIHGHCAHHAQEVIFSITIGNAGLSNDRQVVVGQARLTVPEPSQEMGEELELTVLNPSSGKALKDNPTIRLLVKFVEALPAGGGGIPYAAPSANPDPGAVPRTYFRQHTGCRVTLYQDAHCLEPRRVLELPGGGHYQRELCWDDVYDAIDNAKHLVYIAGWSVNTSTKLVRRQREGQDEDEQETTLGDLLKRKAGQQGVHVLLLVWEDAASISLSAVPFLKKKYIDVSWLGCQATHDKETKAYFKNTPVQCVLVSRDNVHYSHHQKMIIVDHAMPGAAAHSYPRQIVSFVGGLDLCDGRYDTQDHRLFALDMEDFHQVSIKGASLAKGGPRTPWHDIHCRIEGPAAWDVLHTFQQRWKKQGSGKELLVNDTVLMDEQLFVQSSKPVVSPDDDGDKLEAWNVQVFRSIDSTSVEGLFPQDDASQRLERGIVFSHKGNKVVERSVQDAYIHAIRRANNFIYIESQYLIGGAFQWESESNCKANNLVARELSLKIASKIKADQPFAVYVVLPMWPEGIPDGWLVQQILYWQRLTMQMMYRDVAGAIKDVRKEGVIKPEDHLLFFCLGNREPNDGELLAGANAQEAPAATHYAKAQAARRFMIYVHSKMMIVDDEYIIVGSANINQRSMDGTRDTEISMGAYQPHYVNANIQAGGAKGQVYGFRMSLWYEHLGCTQDAPAPPDLLLNPGEPRCVQQVKEWAEENWDKYYTATTPGALPHGHLLPYPIQVDSNGSVTHREGVECFPDTEAPVLGNIGESFKAKYSARSGLC